MASSPSASGTPTDEYGEAWRQLHTHIRNGQSWSGNERNCVFLNTGTPTFADVSAVTGLDFADDGRGLSVVDWDQDGDLDLWFTNRTGPRARFLRNDSENENDFVSIRLRSHSQNTDAIGAEVELFFTGEDAQRHVRTLRAGSSFISQSSKWVHFGVPAGRELSHVSVSWPAGSRTEHHGLSAGARWVLTEGQPTPERWIYPQRNIALEAGALPSPPTDTAARIPIIHPLPMLGLTVEAQDGRQQPVQSAPDGGVLLTLWADWCVNCKRELTHLQEDREKLTEAGLRVLAVSVHEPADRASGNAFLDGLQWSFERAYAHEQLLDILSVSQRVLLDRPRADAIPTSYLLDGAGRLQVIYRGPVDAARVVEDSKSFDSPPIQRRKDSDRFPGQWSTDQIPTRYTRMAIQLRNRGYPELASEYLKRIGIRGDVDDAPEFAVNRMVGSEINTGVELMTKGNTVEAVASFRRALILRPRNPVANKLLGSSLQRLGQAEEALHHLQIAVELKPDDAETRNDLGLTLIDLGHLEAAAESFRKAVQIDPRLAKSHFNLGIYYAKNDDLSEAVTHIAEAVRLNPNYTQAWVTLGRIHSMEGRPVEAIPALRRALELHDSDPDVVYVYGECLIQAGRAGEARALLPKLRQLDAAQAARLEQLLGL